MDWRSDPKTERVAASHPVLIEAKTPADQFGGFRFWPVRWDHRVVQPPQWPNMELKSSPAAIIEQFQLGHFTQGLAMTVSWGKMWRRPEAIWGSPSLAHIEHIESTLRECASSIERTGSIEGAWPLLTGHDDDHLGWSAVISSKTLHFMSRALGFDDDPPVALDNAVIRRRVWPAFIGDVPEADWPGDWNGNGLDAYLRYMTAVRVWAGLKGWTTTELETTLFSEFRGRTNGST